MSDNLEFFFVQPPPRRVVPRPVIDPCEIHLTREEIESARRNAKMRNDYGEAKCTNQKFSKRSNFQVHFEGSSGEEAFRKYMGWEIPISNTSFQKADFPFNIEVKTRTEFWHDCKVPTGIDNNCRVVMAICPNPENGIVWLKGWILAVDGKVFPEIDPYDAGKPFHKVPQSALRPMAELKELIARQNL